MHAFEPGEAQSSREAYNWFLAIAQTNVWNRLNVATGLVAGEWKA